MKRNDRRIAKFVYKLVSKNPLKHLFYGKDRLTSYLEQVQNNNNPIIIDLGAGKKWHPQVIALDLVNYPDIDLCANAEEMPFRDASVDMVICRALLEHVENVEAVLDETRRVLKPGGIFYVTVPFLYPYHAQPLDFQRWTAEGLKRKLENYDCLEYGGVGGPNATLYLILSSYFAWLFSFGRDKLYRALDLIFKQILVPLQIIDNICGKFHPPTPIDSIVYFVGKKSSN